MSGPAMSEWVASHTVTAITPQTPPQIARGGITFCQTRRKILDGSIPNDGEDAETETMSAFTMIALPQLSGHPCNFTDPAFPSAIAPVKGLR